MLSSHQWAVISSVGVKTLVFGSLEQRHFALDDGRDLGRDRQARLPGRAWMGADEVSQEDSVLAPH